MIEILTWLALIILLLVVIGGVLWGIEKYVAQIPPPLKTGLAVILFIVLVIMALGVISGKIHPIPLW